MDAAEQVFLRGGQFHVASFEGGAGGGEALVQRQALNQFAVPDAREGRDVLRQQLAIGQDQ